MIEDENKPAPVLSRSELSSPRSELRTAPSLVPIAPRAELRAAGAKTVMEKIEVSLLNPEQKEALDLLLALGQTHLFDSWEAGISERSKRLFLDQVDDLNQSYAGGLRAYRESASLLLEQTKGDLNRFEGYVPEIPDAVTISADVTDETIQLEQEGLAAANRLAVVLVAGGLGERLGYDGIKIAIPHDLLTDTSYFERYARTLLAIQRRSNGINGTNFRIPFVIMTSDETDSLTKAFLKANNYFGLDERQVHVLEQSSLPALINNRGDFTLEEGDPYRLAAKPSGHGDVHRVLMNSGLVDQWIKEGRTHTLFIQDTNGQVFNGILPALVVSLREKFDMNLLTVPREAKEAAGAVVKMISKTGRSITRNIEYSDLPGFLKATVSPEGDVPDAATGMSPYPANLNVFILANAAYLRVLQKTGGLIAPLVNPKYADPEKTRFLKPARLETMMQDVAVDISALGGRVGVTNFYDKRRVFSPVKNKLADAAQKSQAGNYPDAMATGESDLYKYNRKLLQAAGMSVRVDGIQRWTQGVPYEEGAKVSLSPDFALTAQDVREKIKGGSITDRSALVLDGENIRLENVTIDGTLIIRIAAGASLIVKNLVVRNESWRFEDLTQQELADNKGPLGIRGYKLVKRAEGLVIEIDERGEYEIGANGVLTRRTDRSELRDVVRVQSLGELGDAIDEWIETHGLKTVSFEGRAVAASHSGTLTLGSLAASNIFASGQPEGVRDFEFTVQETKLSIAHAVFTFPRPPQGKSRLPADEVLKLLATRRPVTALTFTTELGYQTGLPYHSDLVMKKNELLAEGSPLNPYPEGTTDPKSETDYFIVDENGRLLLIRPTQESGTQDKWFFVQMRRDLPVVSLKDLMMPADSGQNFLNSRSELRAAEEVVLGKEDLVYDHTAGTAGIRALDVDGFTLANAGVDGIAFVQDIRERFDRAGKTGRLRLAIAYDARPGHREYAQRAFLAALLVARATNVELQFIDQVVPVFTPMELTQADAPDGLRADAVLFWTASHNPIKDYNKKEGKVGSYRGAKILIGGTPLPKEEWASVTQKAKAIRSYELASPDALDAQPAKVDWVGYSVQRIKETIDWDGFVKSLIAYKTAHPNFRLIVDALHGSTAPVVTRLYDDQRLREADILIEVRRTATMDKSHPEYLAKLDTGEPLKDQQGRLLYWAPDPTNPNAVGKLPSAVDEKDVVMLINDGDGDRMVAYESGVEIKPNSLGGVFADFTIAEGWTPEGEVVRTAPTGHMMDYVAVLHDLTTIRTAVGSGNFAEPLAQRKLRIGIEESGHVAFWVKGKLFFDNSVAEGVVMLQMIAARKMSFREIVTDLWQRITAKTNVPRLYDIRTEMKHEKVTNDVKNASKIVNANDKWRNIFMEELAQRLGKELLRNHPFLPIFEREDEGGLRVNFADFSSASGRGSGTEPIYRLYAEASSEGESFQIAEVYGKTIEWVTAEIKAKEPQLLHARSEQSFPRSAERAELRAQEGLDQFQEKLVGHFVRKLQLPKTAGATETSVQYVVERDATPHEALSAILLKEGAGELLGARAMDGKIPIDREDRTTILTRGTLITATLSSTSRAEARQVEGKLEQPTRDVRVASVVKALVQESSQGQKVQITPDTINMTLGRRLEITPSELAEAIELFNARGDSEFILQATGEAGAFLKVPRSELRAPTEASKAVEVLRKELLGVRPDEAQVRVAAPVSRFKVNDVVIEKGRIEDLIDRPDVAKPRELEIPVAKTPLPESKTVNSIEQAVAERVQQAPGLRGQPSVIIRLNGEEGVDRLLADPESDETREALKTLFATVPLGVQKVTIVLPNPDQVRPFNQLIDSYRFELGLSFPPGVQITAKYFGGTAGLMREISNVRTGQAFLITTFDQAKEVAPHLPDYAQAVVGDRFANGASYGTTPRQQFEFAAALLLFTEEFRPNGSGRNILFGEQSTVASIAASLNQVWQKTLHILRAA